MTSTQTVKFKHDLSLDLHVTPAVAEMNKARVDRYHQIILLLLLITIMTMISNGNRTEWSAIQGVELGE